MTANGASGRDACDSIGSIPGAFDRCLRRIAGSAAETFDLLAGILERGAHFAVCSSNQRLTKRKILRL
jgi:hypothetical protein